MGYGAGSILVVVGLVLALAVNDQKVGGVDVTTVGWIMTAVGVVALVLTWVTLNRTHHQRTVQTTTHRDGTQTVNESRTDGL